MILLNITHLHDILKALGHPDATIQEATQQISIVLKIEDVEFPLFIKPVEDGDLLQMLVFFPTTYAPETLSDTSRLLHMLNREVDLPGFCMDETSSTIFYRTVTPCPEGKIRKRLLKALIDSLELICKSFANPVIAIATGQITLEEMLRQASELPSSEENED